MKPDHVTIGQLWEYTVGYSTSRIYVVVDGPRIFDEKHEVLQVMLLDLERGTQRLITAYLITHGAAGYWRPFEP